jgi:hypothetical protein
MPEIGRSVKTPARRFPIPGADPAVPAFNRLDAAFRRRESDARVSVPFIVTQT